LPRLPHLRALVLVALSLISAACAPAAAPSAKPSSSAPTPTSAPPAAAVVASPVAAAPTAPAAPPRVTVKMALQNRPDQAPFELGLARGYFDRQDIEIEPVSTGTGAEVIQAIATNQIDVGTSSPNAAMFNAYNRGVDLRLVADWAHLGDPTDRTLSIVVRADLAESVRSMADLRGRSFAVGGAAGNVGDELFVAAMEKDGASRADVNLSYLSLSDVLAALGGRSLDASTLTEPQVTQAEFQNVARVLYPGGAVIPGAYLSLVVYSPAFAQRSDVATRWMIAYLEGARDYWAAFHENKDRDAAITVLSERLSLKDRRVWETASPEFMDLNGRIDAARLGQQAAFFQREGALTGAVPDLSRFIDPQFAAAAVRQIGAR
jgi:sulfonate transport system substrate-binding protein